MLPSMNHSRNHTWWYWPPRDRHRPDNIRALTASWRAAERPCLSSPRYDRASDRVDLIRPRKVPLSLFFPPKQHVFMRSELAGKQRKHWLTSGATTLTHKKHNHRTFLDSARGKCRLVSLGTGGSILKLKFTVGPGQARRPNLSK